MKEFLAVLSYTFKENSRKKSFIISTIITLILTILIVSLPAIITSFDNNKKSSDPQVNQINIEKTAGVIFVVDSKNLLAGNIKSLSSNLPMYEFKSTTSDNITSIKENINKDKSTALIVLDEKNGVPTFDYFIKQYGSGLAPDTISKVIKAVFVKDLLTTAKVSDNVSDLALKEISYTTKELGKGFMKRRTRGRGSRFYCFYCEGTRSLNT